MDSMQSGNRLDLLNPIAGDKPSPLGERLETAVQGEGHAFQ